MLKHLDEFVKGDMMNRKYKLFAILTVFLAVTPITRAGESNDVFSVSDLWSSLMSSMAQVVDSTKAYVSDVWTLNAPSESPGIHTAPIGFDKSEQENHLSGHLDPIETTHQTGEDPEWQELGGYIQPVG